MADGNETNEECCLSPLDSARFIMERAKHVSINLSALHKLTSQVFDWYSLFFFGKIFSFRFPRQWWMENVQQMIGLVQMLVHLKEIFKQRLIGLNFLKEILSLWNSFIFLLRIFLTSTLNFSFWTDDQSETYIKVYKNKTYHGYEALCVAINQAIDVNKEKKDFEKKNWIWNFM